MSKKLNKAQSNYSVSELECFSAVLSIKKFRPYVEGHSFTLITDHSSLKWLMSQKDLSGRLARWSLKLQMYDFNIEHQKGLQNVVPDTLSRIYCDSITEFEGDVHLLVSEIDIDSDHFNESTYLSFRDKILAAPVQYPSFRVHQDRIFIRIEPLKDVALTDLPSWKLWIPSKMTLSIIQKEHDVSTAAHGGIKKTMERLRRYYYWPGMRKEIYEYVVNCPTCKATKSSNSKTTPPLGITTFAERPWQRIFVDLMGPYPRSKKGNTFILVVLDQLTKFVLLKPLSSSTTSKIAAYLKDEVFLLFNTPETIHTDNGPQFVSKMFQDLMQEFGITHTRTAIYSPQSNASERVNRSIVAAIRAFVVDDHRNWDSQLPEIGCALRSAIHQSTKYSPHFLLFGYHMATNGKSYKLLRELHSLNEPDLELLPISDRLSIIHEKVLKHLKVAYEQYAKRYNLRTRPIEYDTGQCVYVRLHPQSDAANRFCAKFAPRYVKAFIEKKLGNVNYLCTDEKGVTLGKIHAKDIKP